MLILCVQERGEQKLLSLKKEMTALVAERAQQMSQRAIEAWADADDAKKRLVSIRNQIKNLKQDAQTKRFSSCAVRIAELDLSYLSAEMLVFLQS